MAVDKNLFLYDLAVVAIAKDESPYLKEWLDYHLLAGVNHFYIYDNQDDDKQKEVLQPYIDAGLVTHIPYPGKARQYEAYNDAIQDYRFFCRYMAFIDCDEFVFPQTNRSIVEVVDEIFSEYPIVEETQLTAAGLGVNIYTFGSNFQDKADYSKGVLERFTRRAAEDWIPFFDDGKPSGTAHIKTIADPRRIEYLYNPHFASYYIGIGAINENGKRVRYFFNNPPTVEKIVMHHYREKSREEYIKKVNRGTADVMYNIYHYDEEKYTHETETNKIFDDSILKYRDARKKNLGVAELEHDDFLKKMSELNAIDYNKKFVVLLQNLAPAFVENAPQNFFTQKMEIFLICRKLSEVLREKNFLDQTIVNALEETALKCTNKTLLMTSTTTVMDLLLLADELPNILPLKYPVVDDIRSNCLEIIPKILNVYRTYDAISWLKFVNMKYVLKMLELFDHYELK